MEIVAPPREPRAEGSPLVMLSEAVRILTLLLTVFLCDSSLSSSRLFRTPTNTKWMRSPWTVRCCSRRMAASSSDLEVLLWGDPRHPPPFTKRVIPAHLYWSRHAHAVAKTATERRSQVFPQLTYPHLLERHRLPRSQLTYDGILNRFLCVRDDIDAAKLFVRANIERVPPALFVRAITRAKLHAQSRNDTRQMEFLKQVRERYVAVSDQVMFPAYVEFAKAHTRVETHLPRIASMHLWAATWDEVELSLFFALLLARRLQFDYEVQCGIEELTNRIAASDADTFFEVERKLVLHEQVLTPALSAELFRNASRDIAMMHPALYRRVAPELRLLHEAYLVAHPAQLRR